jgi:hypothetical protein
MKLTHKFAKMAPDKRPQDPSMDGTGISFETLEHGGEYPDTMPQAIKLTDAEGRSCIYVPITDHTSKTAINFRLPLRRGDTRRGNHPCSIWTM